MQDGSLGSRSALSFSPSFWGMLSTYSLVGSKAVFLCWALIAFPSELCVLGVPS